MKSFCETISPNCYIKVSKSIEKQKAKFNSTGFNETGISHVIDLCLIFVKVLIKSIFFLYSLF